MIHGSALVSDEPIPPFHPIWILKLVVMQSKLNHSIILLKALNRLAEKHLFKNEFEEFYEHKLGQKPLSILLPPVPTNTE